MSRVGIGGIGMYTNFQIRPGGPEYVGALPFVQIFFCINQSNPVSFVLSVHCYIFASAVRNDIYFPRKYPHIHKYYSQISFKYFPPLWRCRSPSHDPPPLCGWFLKAKTVAINSLNCFFLYVVAIKFDKLCILLYFVGF